MKKNIILFVYGEGGHTAQMNRLAHLIRPNLIDSNIISISDDTKQPAWSDEHVITGEARGKYTHLQLLTNFGPLKILCSLNKLRRKYKIDAVLTTGPGLGFISAVYFKLFHRAKVVHVETWSRFTTYSLTGRLMYLISDRFYVQNKSLLKLYPKAIYSGKL